VITLSGFNCLSKQNKLEKPSQKISTHIVGPVGEVEAEVLDGVLRAGRHFGIGDN
jgi:hypothetical protein